MFNLEKKVIVVTGASSGIGQGCAVACSKMGAKLILFGRNIEKLKHTFSMLHGQVHLIFIQDIREDVSFESSIREAVNKIGQIDGFIHSAGLQTTLPLRLHTKDVFANQFDINVVGGFEACRVLTKKEYFNASGGSIVFISSIRALLGTANQLGYSASKGAVIAGARALAIELANRNIRVNAVSPGMVEDTEMTKEVLNKLPADWAEKNKLAYPLGWVHSEDIANACLFLLSDGSKKITGTNLVVDGGFSAQ